MLGVLSRQEGARGLEPAQACCSLQCPFFAVIQCLHSTLGWARWTSLWWPGSRRRTPELLRWCPGWTVAQAADPPSWEASLYNKGPCPFASRSAQLPTRCWHLPWPWQQGWLGLCEGGLSMPPSTAPMWCCSWANALGLNARWTCFHLGAEVYPVSANDFGSKMGQSSPCPAAQPVDPGPASPWAIPTVSVLGQLSGADALNGAALASETQTPLRIQPRGTDQGQGLSARGSPLLPVGQLPAS